MFESYYSILNIPNGSDEENIKKAFRQLALKTHPDVNPAPDANEKFQQLCYAYEILISHTRQLREVNVGSFSQSEDLYNLDDLIRGAHIRANSRARMKYEKLKAEKELFEKSEYRDVFIALKYLGSFLGILLGLWLITWPLYYAIIQGLHNIFALLLFWTGGFFLLRHIYNNRKTWFSYGKLNFSTESIKEYFDFALYSNVTTDCAYCRGHKGKGRPFRFSMLKVHNVKLRNNGPFQHNAGYTRTYKDLIVPRSKKAFYVHFGLSFLKPIIIIAGIILIPFPGIIWRFVMAFCLSFVIACLLLLITRTRSKVSYLLTPLMIIKILIWVLVIISQSTVYPGFILANTDFLILFLALMLVFLDMVLDLILRIFPFYYKLHQPIPKQLPGISYLFRKGYQPFLDVPVWSTIYPFFRWLF